MSERGANPNLVDHGGTLTATAWPLVPQRLFDRMTGSQRGSFTSRVAMILGRAELPGRGELAGLRPVTRFLIVGLTVWLGLVGLATITAVASVELSTLSLPAWLGARASASPNTEIRSPAGFENILQRPLFSRSRQGAAVAVSVAMAPPPPVILDPNFTLKGVFMSGELAKAFLTSAQNPLGAWVQANDEVAGWRVVAVKPDQVLLDARNEKLVVSLSVNGPPK